MTETATGIILRTRPLTETSLIVHWLTPELGRLATVAKGARRPQSPFASKLDLFYRADFSFSRSRSSDLHILREVNLKETFPTLRENIGRLQQAGYATHLIELATETETPISSIYDLLLGFANSICTGTPAPQTVFALELKLLQDLGLEPDWETTQISPGAKQITQKLLTSDWENIARLKLSGVQVAELRRFLQEFILFHLGHLPRGRNGALGETKSETKGIKAA
jgi:DNA repair protein RecO (recombination protein O)